MATVITDGAKLGAGMRATADAIRAKTGRAAPLAWDYAGETGFAAAVAAIHAAAPVLTSLVADENGTYTPPAGVDGFATVVVGVARRSPRCDQLTDFNLNGSGLNWAITAAFID